MKYVFEDGRIIYTEELLTPDDVGQYIEVEELPPIPPKEGKTGYWIADLTKGELVAVYVDIPEPQPEPEPPTPEPTPTDPMANMITAQNELYYTQYHLLGEKPSTKTATETVGEWQYRNYLMYKNYHDKGEMLDRTIHQATMFGEITAEQYELITGSVYIEEPLTVGVNANELLLMILDNQLE